MKQHHDKKHQKTMSIGFRSELKLGVLVTWMELLQSTACRPLRWCGAPLSQNHCPPWRHHAAPVIEELNCGVCQSSTVGPVGPVGPCAFLLQIITVDVADAADVCCANTLNTPPGLQSGEQHVIQIHWQQAKEAFCTRSVHCVARVILSAET